MTRRRKPHSRKSGFKLKLKQSTVYTLSAIFLWATAILIWLSFVKQGVLLFQINAFLVGQLGTVATLFLPFTLVIAGLMVAKSKTAAGQPNVFVGSLLVLAVLTGIFRGGQLGQQIWDNIAVFVSGLGAFIFLLTAGLIGVLVMFNVSFEEIFGYLSKLFKSFSRRPKINSPADKPLNSVVSAKASLSNQPIKISGLTDKPVINPTSSDKNSPSPRVPAPPVIASSDRPWQYPPTSLLGEGIGGKADRGNVNDNANTIEQTLEAFGVIAKVIEINKGPAVTQYALQVAIGTKLSKINSLGSDLALALAAPTGQIRIEAPIPGRALVGIEVPNRSPEFVSLKRILEDPILKNHPSKLAVAMGLDVSGQPVVADIAKMPHVLIAGATGSGKSVCINTFLASLLFRCSPQELNLILVDPKRVELTSYNGIPHLLTPVIVEPEKVLSALKWAGQEMDRRYKLFAEVGAKNLEAYNQNAGFQAMPYIVIFIDELADIMLFAQVEVEDAITRIAQMARATGIHLVLATQRPSIDIITGLIKANIPARIAFAVSSMIDSRVIIDSPGAEKLLGRGDMLYVPPDQAKPSRIQGAFISDKDTHQLIEFVKKQGIAPHYTDEILTQPINTRKGGQRGGASFSTAGEDRDELFETALRLVVSANNASSSYLQRKLQVGYARAAKILDQMHEVGAIGPSNGSKPRDILITDVDAFLSGQSIQSANREN